jgi:nucleoid DNA-binding protein
MNKTDITRRLAKSNHRSQVEAADYLDQAVLSILKGWKHGHPTVWPGLGIFSRNPPKEPKRKVAKTEAL